MRRFTFALLLLIQGCLADSASADELRPAYFSMRETSPDEFSLFWRTPALGDRRLGLYLQLPANCVAKVEPVRSIENSAYSERWTAVCNGGLKNRTIAIDGLRSTTTDALARIEYRDGSVEIARLTAEVPRFVVAGSQSGWEVAWTYFLLGVDHILSGYDHLLFVFALILLINDFWMLTKTVTAFTLAHSITLAGASLGYFSLPQKPVEATIALSIAFVASELIKQQPGERRLSESYPWVVAFTFGLLHGFGFAGALKETGLPQNDVPVALLTFNIGVETGQLMFVASVWMASFAVRSFITVPTAPVRVAAAYLIGVVSMLWFVARISSFGAGV